MGTSLKKQKLQKRREGGMHGEGKMEPELWPQELSWESSEEIIFLPLFIHLYYLYNYYPTDV